MRASFRKHFALVNRRLAWSDQSGIVVKHQRASLDCPAIARRKPRANKNIAFIRQQQADQQTMSAIQGKNNDLERDCFDLRQLDLA